MAAVVGPLPKSTRTTTTYLLMSSSSANDKACRPCSGLDTSDLLDINDVRKRVLETLPLWTVESKNGDALFYLHRTFHARNFQAALNALNDMGAVAETESHHPNFHLTNYRELGIEIWTHKLNGVSENDLLLACKFDDQVKIDYSPKWLKEHPEAAWTAKP